MSAPGSTPLGPPGPPASRRGGPATPVLPSAPRRRFCLRCVKWLGGHPAHTCLQEPSRTKCDRCSTNGSPCHKVPPRYHVAAARVETDAAAVAILPANRRAAARTALAAPAATLGSRVDRFNRHRRSEAGDRRQLSLYERSTLRFQELLLARLNSLESAYRAAHGQPAAIPDDDETDDDGDDDGDTAGDGDGSGAAGAGLGGS
ncbi:MAG: hypothetical protein M1816_005332 [Peltula sp. TS41687]|nr:MAG: hypothetical protein M1816_005332 [Peltula sp. TS41687]